MSPPGNTPSTPYTVSYTSTPKPSSSRSSRTRKPKRSDSLETVRPASPKLPQSQSQSTQSNPTSPKSPRSKPSVSSKSSSTSESKSAEKKARPLSARRYSAEGLWKAVSKSTLTEGSNLWIESGVTRSSSPTSPSSSHSSSTSSSSSGSESRGRKTHKILHAAYGIGLGLPSTRKAHDDDGSRDVTPRAPGKQGPQKSASCSQLTGENGNERQPTTSISTVNVQDTLFEPHHRTKEGGESKGESASMEGGSDDSRDSPRLPLQDIGSSPLSTSPEPVEDEFVDMDIDSDEDTVPIHIEGTRSRSISPKEGHGDDWSDEGSSDNDYFEVLLPKWRRRVQTNAKDGSRSSGRTDPKAPRVSLRIRPRENHVTFWDAKDGEDLLIKGRLELTDRLRETRCHYAEIYVRSFVGVDIRSIEHLDDPEFVLHHKDSDTPEDDGPFKSSRQVDLEETGQASKNGTNGLPSWAKAALEDMENDKADKDDDKPRITTYHWTQSVGGEVPMWVKYFTVPIPARLFDSRESRVFRIEAKVGYFSTISTGEYREVGAPLTQVSVTHLNSGRELGIWNRVPPQNTFTGFP